MGSRAAVVLLYSSTGEASYGSTAGVASKKLHGLTDASLQINTQVEAVDAVGWYGPSPVAAEVAQSGEGTLEAVATFEELPNLLNGVFTAIAASATTAAPYSFQYSAPVTSTQACYTYALEYGTTGQVYKSLGTVFNGITLSGEVPGYWRASVPVLAKQVVGSTLTTTANVDRTVNPIKVADTSLYVDPFSTGTFGATAVTGTLISFELSVGANRHLKTFAGSKFPSSWGDDRMSGTLNTVVEFNASAKAYIDAMVGSTGAEVQRHIRLKASQTSSTLTATIDFAGIIGEPVKLWDDREGNLTASITWKGKYSTGLASGNWLQITLEHGSSSTT